MERKTEREEERVVQDIGMSYWDGAPYSLAIEIKRLLASMVDENTGTSSGHGTLWPWGAPAAIAGHAEADLHLTIGGVEFYITVRKSNGQLIKEGVTREALGLSPLNSESDDQPTPASP